MTTCSIGCPDCKATAVSLAPAELDQTTGTIEAVAYTFEPCARCAVRTAPVGVVVEAPRVLALPLADPRPAPGLHGGFAKGAQTRPEVVTHGG